MCSKDYLVTKDVFAHFLQVYSLAAAVCLTSSLFIGFSGKTSHTMLSNQKVYSFSVFQLHVVSPVIESDHIIEWGSG